jgi:hypothetical protein
VDRHKDGEQGANVYRDMSLSVFCLAATGAGWGVRFQQSIMMGCIPVVIGDGVEVHHHHPPLPVSAVVPQFGNLQCPVKVNTL